MGIVGIEGAGLDVQYMRFWAFQLGVVDLLKKALSSEG